ncbi:Homeobox B7 [Cichlidogyrus casuarinus]|uniref:Homeobox B7 n=1 Tax=Cichlidogyrus casuarinus TaxID=1844966 RepID=A0ABD2PNR6_9PLAT
MQQSNSSAFYQNPDPDPERVQVATPNFLLTGAAQQHSLQSVASSHSPNSFHTSANTGVTTLDNISPNNSSLNSSGQLFDETASEAGKKLSAKQTWSDWPSKRPGTSKELDYLLAANAAVALVNQLGNSEPYSSSSSSANAAAYSQANGDFFTQHQHPYSMNESYFGPCASGPGNNYGFNSIEAAAVLAQSRLGLGTNPYLVRNDTPLTPPHQQQTSQGRNRIKSGGGCGDSANSESPDESASNMVLYPWMNPKTGQEIVSALAEVGIESKRTRQTYTRFQTLELEKEFHYNK